MKIGASAGAKINKGNYESEDFNIWIEHEIDEIDDDRGKGTQLLEKAIALQDEARKKLWKHIHEQLGERS